MEKCIALDIGGTYVKYAIVFGDGEITHYGKELTTQIGAKSLLNQISSIIENLLKLEPHVKFIGISSAGQINSNEGNVIYATDNLPGWSGVKIKKEIEKEFSLPCHVENDVNAAALGELHFGKYKLRDFLCLTYGTGIGGAIIQKGSIVTGSHYCAAEFGHIIIDKNGELCNCGNRGCYEQYASVSALVKSSEKRLKEEGFLAAYGAEWLFESYHKNENVTAILDEYFYNISIGLTNLVHIFNPKIIIIGGAISKNKLFISKLQELTIQRVMPSFRRDLQIIAASLHNDASLVGAVVPFLKGVENVAATND